MVRVRQCECGRLVPLNDFDIDAGRCVWCVAGEPLACSVGWWAREILPELLDDPGSYRPLPDTGDPDLPPGFFIDWPTFWAETERRAVTR